MENNISFLVNKIGNQYIIENIEKYISYINVPIEEPNKKCNYVEAFYSDNLANTITDVSQNIALKITNDLDDCVKILNILNKCCTKLLINKAEYISIEKTYITLKLINSNAPQTNVAIIVNASLIKQDLQAKYDNYINSMYLENVETNILFSIFCLIIIIMYYL